MLAQLLEFLTMQMYELAALFALVMEADPVAMALHTYVFKAGRGIVVYIVFVYRALGHHFFKVTVDRGCAYRRALCLEMLAYLVYGDMAALSLFKIIKQYITLFCLVL